MEAIVVTGELDPVAALDLRERLARATAVLRPVVEVDLAEVSAIHVAAVSALIQAARRAKRQGGELRIEPPRSARARRELALPAWFPTRIIEGPRHR
ncbi:MAG: STAS domain-containing protein [Acidimicrobiia bacterium]|nr:STAS domain-containing protein [Acidimicrobiia bacterium]